MADYTTVTETSNLKASREQVSMLYTRYRFAADYCLGKAVLEVACGAGQGLGYLAKTAKKVIGGDYTENLLKSAQRYYRGRVPLIHLDGHTLPFCASSFDVVVLYEAIYYFSRPDLFLKECRRVLQKSGVLLLCTVNKEWCEFNPSPFSVRYFTARELMDLLRRYKFQAQLSGAFPANRKSIKDDINSFLKRTAICLDLMPKTMKGKKFLKRMFFGPLQALPPEVFDGMASYYTPESISLHEPCSAYKVIFAVAHVI